MVLLGYLTPQQMLVPELMVSFPLPLHINLSNNCTNRLLDYGQAWLEAISLPEIDNHPVSSSLAQP